MKQEVMETFDTKGKFRCVRLDTGEAAVVDELGRIMLRIGRCRHLVFAEHGFVKVTTGVEDAMRNPDLRNLLSRDIRREGVIIPTTYYVDVKSGHPYADLPEILRYGEFEVSYIGSYLCTRTRQYCQVKGEPDQIYEGQGVLCIKTLRDDAPDQSIIDKMIEKNAVFIRCLISGDAEKVYWKLNDFEDGSVLVMDDDGVHFYVRRDKETGEVVLRNLGKMNSEAARAIMMKNLKDIEKDAEKSAMAELQGKLDEQERQRREALKGLSDAEPIKIGDKWGLRLGGRITVPPIYRSIEAPIGLYSVMEASCGCWGVVAVDGRVEIEPRYEKVVLHEDGCVELTVFRGKVITAKVGN